MDRCRRKVGAALALAPLAFLLGQDVALAQAPGDAAPARKAHDIISIARREAARENQALMAQVGAILTELESSSDDKLSFIQTRIDSLAALGVAAIPAIAAAMNHDGSAPGRDNVAINSARAIARIGGSEAFTELVRIAREGNDQGRRYAAYALGLRGDSAATPTLRALLKDGNAAVLVETIVALVALSGESVRGDIAPFVESMNDSISAAACEALASIGTPEIDQAIIARLRQELSGDKPSESLLYGALYYLTSRPSAVTVSLASDMLRNGNNSFRVRRQAVAALTAIGNASSGDRKDVVAALKLSLGVGPRAISEAIALAMNTLGDESGLSTVTASLDEEIDSNSKNANARYQRGELFLRFEMWKRARKDFNDGYGIEKKQPVDQERVFIGMARAYAGMGQARDAAKWLQRLAGMDLSHLPTDYPEFREMAQESRYADLFAKKD